MVATVEAAAGASVGREGGPELVEPVEPVLGGANGEAPGATVDPPRAGAGETGAIVCPVFPGTAESVCDVPGRPSGDGRGHCPLLPTSLAPFDSSKSFLLLAFM